MDKLDLHREQLRDLPFFAETKEAFKGEKFTHIRCLALGQPTASFQARYQLAYLLELADHLEVEPSNISHWDPVFDENDTELLVKQLGHRVDEVYDVPTGQVLYFMPHAELTMTNDILKQEQPRWLLANNIVHHTDRYTKQKLMDTYPLIAHIVHALESSAPKDENKDKNAASDGFERVAPKRRNRKQFVPQPITYDFDEYYFSGARQTAFVHNQLKLAVWQNSFLDLLVLELTP
ncbi:hypothetical protein JNB11_03310 [Kocuria palustris]|nr:hypothetical protein [Kocuria palustris]